MSSYVWNSAEVKKLNYGTVYGNWKSKGLSIDSRNIENCQLFVAFQGERVDGHDYIKSALDNGASAFIAKFIPDNINTNEINCWIVEDVQKAIEILALHNRNRSKARFVAVTGSVGKTSVTNSTAKVLEVFGPTYSTKGNFNNEIGLPLCLASMPLDAKYGVFELGMRGFGQISYLTRFVRPDISVITKIAPAHIESLGSLENIAKAKSEIFEHTSKDAVAVFNGDGEYSGIMRGVAEENNIKNIITFGEEGDNDIKLLSFQQGELSSVWVQLFDTEIKYDMNLRGRHRALNSLPVLAIVKILGLDLSKALKIISSLSELKGRGQKTNISIGGKEMILIDESYNSSPESLESSLLVLSEFSVGKEESRKIAFLSDMLELGEGAEQEHKKIVSLIIDSKIDKIYAFGNHMKSLFDALPKDKKGAYFSSLAEMKLEIENLLHDQDIILVKGSFGTKIYEIVELLKKASGVL